MPERKLSDMTFVELPQRQIKDTLDYRKWMIEEVERKWMTQFNYKNEDWRPNPVFNTESDIHGYFGGIWFYHCKFHRYDGNMSFAPVGGFIAHRGFLIRELPDALGAGEKVQLIANNLEEFLKQEKIRYIRKDC